MKKVLNLRIGFSSRPKEGKSIFVNLKIELDKDKQTMILKYLCIDKETIPIIKIRSVSLFKGMNNVMFDEIGL